LPAIAAAAAVVATAAAATAAAVARLLRACFVDRHRTTAVVRAVQLINGRLRFGVARHFDEPETLASAGLPIRNQLRRFDSAERRELLDGIVCGGGERQVADVQFSAQLTSLRA